MGKKRAANSNRSVSLNIEPHQNSAQRNNANEVDLNSIIEEVDTEINNFNYEEAEKKCSEALKIYSDNVKLLETLASIKIEQMKCDEAKQILLKCIELEPDDGYTRYFSLGQICNGKESLKLYEKGIIILEKKLEDTENVEPTEEINRSTLQRSISDAYCSISEIFMTDCCFEDNAEEECLKAIENAIKSDTSNPEAYQCLANFRLVKEEFEEAKSALEKSLSLWLPQYEEYRNCELAENESQINFPEYDSRIKTSKLLIELEMFDVATVILEGLLEEDDQVMEVWYLLGWLNYLQADNAHENAYYYLKKAKKIGVHLGGDEDQVEHIEVLLEELKNKYNFDDDTDEEISDISIAGEKNELDLSSDSENDDIMDN